MFWDNIKIGNSVFKETESGWEIKKSNSFQFHKPQYKDKPLYKAIEQIEENFQDRYNFILKDSIKEIQKFLKK